jgi:biopolymer transport protein ExbD
VPVPIERLPQYLSADPEQRKAIYKQTQGVPMDTVNTRNQLDDWIFEARKVKNQYHQLNPEATTKDFRLAIKADRDTPYPIIQRITEVLKGQQANKFSLITDKKATPK